MESVFIAIAILCMGAVVVRASNSSVPSTEDGNASSSGRRDMGAIFGLPSLTKPHVKEISLVLVRLHDYDDLVSRVDLETLFRLEDAFYSQLIKVAEAWQGEVDRFDGQSVLLAFGRILEVEDHREHAREAARALLRSLPDALCAVTCRNFAPAATVVVTAGTVIIGPVGVDYRKVFTVFGPVVNEAYRWSLRSLPGTIVVGANRGFEGLEEWGDIEEQDEVTIVTPRHREDR